MIKVALSAVVFAVALSAPALADFNPGPVKNGTQCWKDAATRKGEFGYWGACPAAAKVTAAPKQARPQVAEPKVTTEFQKSTQ